MLTALVTGATAGIGARFARHLAGEGYNLVLVARDKNRLDQAAATHCADHGIAVEVLVADLSTDEGIAAVEHRVAEGVDLVVNNAGFGQQGSFLSSELTEEIDMLKVHCEAVLRITRAALPPMLERGRGGVINVASVAAFFSRGTYSASKMWVVTFSDSVRQQITGSGVHVMALCPGWVRTEFHERSGMDTAGIPGFMWLDAARLVTEAMRDLRNGVPVSMPGIAYRVLTGLGKILPRRVTSALSARMGSRHHS
ncbi:short-subunit dehydrogenase [Kibdelosporangium banguiense]|uniref:Short-subunit dehydrogenase n=1 Tax=Kibdelosporangium banguiense TaxID=1365924 RepID=A0ABS4TQE0_9PSEU|nr:SDR family oxidoreductase [Kibdelosporangium banguiense]MBP2326624.1 short-subunit dehydrogenase [Kibdelosporangium banguiense]